MMEQIPSPIRRSWSRQCSCGAAWRFYEDDIQAVSDEYLYIVCPNCAQDTDVASLLRYSVRNKLAVAAIRAKREKTDA